MRMITSCLECRRRKLRCDKLATCSNCMRFSRECVYIGPKLDEAGQLRLTEIKEKVGSLERQLERDVARSTAKALGPRQGHRSQQQQLLASDGLDEDYDAEGLDFTPMVTSDATYEDDENTDELIDLGIQVGKMRITERIGGMNRPRISEEISAGISTHASPAHMMRGLNAMGMAGGIPNFLRPGASYIAPTGGFFFGQAVESPSVFEFLPSEFDRQRLIARYFEAVHPITRCVHEPSFQALYESFRLHVDIQMMEEPRPSTQAVVFAALFSAAVSLDENDVLQQYGTTKAVLVNKLKLGTESALSKADFLRTTKVETLQAFVMFLIPLCRDEVSRAHSVLVGAAIRMAECMGLHRDGESYGLTPLETQVRRLIWYQLCFLDIRTCEAQGPRPAIHQDDFNTALPFNCDDDEDLTGPAAPRSSDGWTPALFCCIRFEINEFMRLLWFERRKLEMRRQTLVNVVHRIDKFRKGLADRYFHRLKDRTPMQEYTKLVIQLLVHRLYAMVLHPYHANVTNPMPDNFKDMLVHSGVGIIETAIQLEQDPTFRAWRWYLGAYQQYQIALLLATEVYYRPANQFANKIWRCLDYVFCLDPNMPRDEKSLGLLAEIMEKTSVYMNMRKMRAPTAIAKAVPDRQAVKDSPPQGTSPLQPSPPMTFQPILPEAMPATAVPNMSFPHHDSNPFAQMTFPPQNMIFGGVSNGEALWSLPPAMNVSGSHSPDGSISPEISAQRQSGNVMSAPTLSAGMNMTEQIDWV